MASLGTNRLNIVNDQPSVEKLWNGRYRLEFYCDNDGKKTDWYYTNVGNILPDFGTLQGDGFGENPSESIPASKYADMRLIEVGTEYVPAANQHYVKLTYETLTAAWVLEKDEDTDYELNGLKRVTRQSVALPDAAYTNVVGTSTITSDGTTLYLGSYKIEETDAKWALTEVWLEAGTLSETTDFVGSQQSRVIETIGADPATPSGYLLASKQESNFEGFQTNRFTFLKPSILSVRTPLIGGQQTVVVTAFSMTEAEVDADLAEVTASHKLIDQNDSDYEGIKTSQFTFEVDDFETRSYTESGLLVLTKTQLGLANFSDGAIGTDTLADGAKTLYLGGEDIDNGGSIKKKVQTWLEAGILSVSEKNLSEGVKEVTTVFFAIAGTTVGPIIAKDTSSISGLPTISITTLQDKQGNSIVQGGENLVHSYGQLAQFTYPGIVTIEEQTLTGTGSLYDFESKDFKMIPPVEALVPATTYVFFQDSNAIASSDYIYDGALGLWNPTRWATGLARGIGWNYAPFSKSLAFRGYRSVPAQFVGTEDGDPWALITGTRMFENTSWEIRLEGGPQDPRLKKFVLDVKISTAFDDVSNATYYKKVITVANIPDQNSDVLT